MGAFEFLLIIIAAGLVIYFTVLFVFKVKKKGRVVWGDFKQWLKNVIDSLFGIG